MEEGLPDESTIESREGTDLHTFLAHPEYDRSFLKQHLQDLLKSADELDQQLFDTVIQNEKLLDSAEYVEMREVEREWNGMTGHIDMVRRYPKHHITIIRDAKFGFLPVERAELNKQLRGYAVLSNDYVVYVAIIQPRAPFNQRITVARYSDDDIKNARVEILLIIQQCADPNAPLRAGEWCRFCRARGVCPELMREVQKGLVPFDKMIPVDLSKTAKLGRVEARLAQLSDDDLSKMLQAYSLIQFVSEPMMDEARRRIQAGEFDGWKLSKPMERRKIVNSQRAISLLSLAGMSREDIMECANLSLTKLEEKLNHGKLRTGQVIVGAKDAREFTTHVLSSVLELEVGKPRVLKK